MFDIKDLYKERYEKLTASRKEAQDNVSKINKEKELFIKDAMQKAKEKAEHDFWKDHGAEEIAAAYALEQARNELILLRCPEERSHRRNEGEYYRCKTCGDVWDDTSPAHP